MDGCGRLIDTESQYQQLMIMRLNLNRLNETESQYQQEGGGFPLLGGGSSEAPPPEKPREKSHNPLNKAADSYTRLSEEATSLCLLSLSDQK